MTFPQRLRGVFLNPAATMADVALRPKPIAPILVLLLVLTSVFAYVAAPYAAKDSLDLMRDNVKMKDSLGEERFDKMISGLENPKPGAVAFRSFIVSPIFTAVFFAIQALFLLILGRLASPQGNFVPVLSVLLHASVINTLLGNAVRTFLILIRKSVMQVTTSLAMLLPQADVTSTSYILLSQLDLFQLWTFGVVGYGLSAVFKVPARKGIVLAYVFWAVKALFNASLSFLGKSFMG